MGFDRALGYGVVGAHSLANLAPRHGGLAKQLLKMVSMVDTETFLEQVQQRKHTRRHDLRPLDRRTAVAATTTVEVF